MVSGQTHHPGVAGNAARLLLGRVGKTFHHLALMEVAEKAVFLVGSAIDIPGTGKILLVASAGKTLLIAGAGKALLIAGAGKARVVASVDKALLVAHSGYTCPMGEETGNLGSGNLCPTDRDVRSSCDDVIVYRYELFAFQAHSMWKSMSSCSEHTRKM